MPELPDVEAFARSAQPHILRRPVRALHVPDRRILKGETPAGLGRRLKGRAFTDVRRHGKLLFLIQGGKHGALELHFGMTGSMAWLHRKDEQPDHTRLVVEYARGDRLVVTSQRLLGHVKHVADEEQRIHDKGLGPDALGNPLTESVFRERIFESRAAVKSALMDQSRIAGIGNVYADEILFQAGIKPGHSANTLQSKAHRRLYRSMRRVLSSAADRLTEGRAFPAAWLLPHREMEASCPRCRRALKHIKISGRTTWYCGHCQL